MVLPNRRWIRWAIQHEMAGLERKSGGWPGVALIDGLIDTQTDDKVFYRGGEKFPMCSTSEWRDGETAARSVRTRVTLYSPKALFILHSAGQVWASFLRYQDTPVGGWILYLSRPLTPSEEPEAQCLASVPDADGKRLGMTVISIADRIRYVNDPSTSTALMTSRFASWITICLLVPGAGRYARFPWHGFPPGILHGRRPHSA